MKDFPPILSRISQKTLLEVSFHLGPLIPVTLHSRCWLPAVVEHESFRKCSVEPVDEHLEELRFQTAHSHEASTFAFIYVIERCTTIQSVSARFPLPIDI